MVRKFPQNKPPARAQLRPPLGSEQAFSHKRREMGHLFSFFFARRLNDAEEISVGIFQDYEIGSRSISPGIAAGAELQKPVDFRFLVVGVKVQMQPAAPWRPRVSCLKR